MAWVPSLHFPPHLLNTGFPPEKTLALPEKVKLYMNGKILDCTGENITIDLMAAYNLSLTLGSI